MASRNENLKKYSGETVMKKVTESRILEAHKRVDRFKEELIERDSEKIKALVCLGLKAVCHEANGLKMPDHESHRMGL
jgi:hypothetical protein